MAQALDDVRRLPNHVSQSAGRRRPDVAGRPDIAFEEPGFVIEAAGIGVTVRTFQANSKLPALARAHRLALELLVIAPPLIPGEHDALRHDGCGRPAFTSNSKRVPWLKSCGRLAMTPTTSTSRPSQACGS